MLEIILILLLAAVFGVIFFRMLHLPPMLGYLVVGVVIGPYAFGLIGEHQGTHRLAEFGVVFLMFSIGLEFSLPKLKAMRSIVFGLGLAQVLLTIGVTLFAGWVGVLFLPKYFPFNWQTSFALGGALAMSSTAIVSKILTERMELESEHGRRMIAILLFQDLAFVPLLILVPALASTQGNLGNVLGWAILKAVVVLFLLLAVGRRLVRWWFTVVTKRRSQELFMLNLLLMTLGTAWITEKAGLSLALGAFVAGMLISETEYKYQVEVDIKPFRDVLLGLFFITIGMMLNINVVVTHWYLVLLLVLIPVFVKFILIASLARLFGAKSGTALRTGLGLAQGGEFGFVLLTQATGLKLVDPFMMELILASMVISMLIAPFILANMDAIVLKFSKTDWMTQSLALTQLATKTMTAEKHVIIAGFGRTGQNLAKLLTEEGWGYYALERDPELVKDAHSAGAQVSYGDASRKENLLAAGVHRASALVVTYKDTPSTLRILHLVHELVPNLPVLVRSYDDVDLGKLREAGATEVVPEVLEGSLMLASHVLVLLGVPLRRVVHRVQVARSERYASFRGYFHGVIDEEEDAEHLQVRLHSVLVEEKSKALGHTLAELNLPVQEVDVVAVRRGGKNLDVTKEFVFVAGDIVVLRGTLTQLEDVNHIFAK
jgi:CPA2 family monovalent cation:H+ antiporter-2